MTDTVCGEGEIVQWASEGSVCAWDQLGWYISSRSRRYIAGDQLVC